MKVTNSKERIRDLMRFYGITQAELSKRTGITEAAISNYLHGTREPRQDKISAIADAFGVSPAWVMGYSVPMKEKPDSTDRLLSYYRKLCELKGTDQEIIFNQIDFLRGRENED